MVHYRWFDYFSKRYRLTRCEVVESNGRTALIRILEFGRNGAPPGTTLRVHTKSLVGYSPAPPPPPSTPPGSDWRDYCYFE